MPEDFVDCCKEERIEWCAECRLHYLFYPEGNTLCPTVIAEGIKIEVTGKWAIMCEFGKIYKPCEEGNDKYNNGKGILGNK